MGYLWKETITAAICGKSKGEVIGFIQGLDPGDLRTVMEFIVENNEARALEWFLEWLTADVAEESHVITTGFEVAYKHRRSSFTDLFIHWEAERGLRLTERALLTEYGIDSSPSLFEKILGVWISRPHDAKVGGSVLGHAACLDDLTHFRTLLSDSTRVYSHKDMQQAFTKVLWYNRDVKHISYMNAVLIILADARMRLDNCHVGGEAGSPLLWAVVNDDMGLLNAVLGWEGVDGHHVDANEWGGIDLNDIYCPPYDPYMASFDVISSCCLYGRVRMARRILGCISSSELHSGSWCIRKCVMTNNAPLLKVFLNDGRTDPSEKYNEALRYACSRDLREVAGLLRSDPRVRAESVRHKVAVDKQKRERKDVGPRDVGPGRKRDVGPGRKRDVGPGRKRDVGPGRKRDVGPGRKRDAGPGRKRDAGPGRKRDVGPGRKRRNKQHGQAGARGEGLQITETVQHLQNAADSTSYKERKDAEDRERYLRNFPSL